MKKYFAILLSLSFLFLPSVTRIKAQSSQIPNVYIKNIQLQKTDFKTGEIITGTFQTLTDAVTVASDIYFTISLVGDYQKNGLANAFYDSTTTASSYNIKAGETKTINFSYTIPQVKTGAGYGIQIQGMTHTSIPLGWSDAFIKITNAGNVQYLNTISAKLDVGTSTFALQEGPMVSADKPATLDLIVKNPTLQPVTFTPNIALYDHVVIGSPLLTNIATSTTIAAGKQEEILIPLPTNNNAPLVYVSHVSFLDANGAQRLTALDARYIVQGDIATIQNVTTDKHSFNKGDTVAVTLDFSGTPFDISNGNNQTTAVYDTAVNLLNSQNQPVATWTGSIDYNNATNTKTVLLTATQLTNGYTADVLVTKAGKTITHYNYQVEPDANPKTSAQTPAPTSTGSSHLFIDSLLILVIAVVFIILIRRNRKIGSIILFLVLLFGLSYIVLDYLSVKKAGAQMYAVDNYAQDGGNIHQKIVLTTSHPIPDPTTPILPGLDTFTVDGTASAWACSNSLDTVSVRVELRKFQPDGVNEISGDIKDSGYVTYASYGGSGGENYTQHSGLRYTYTFSSNLTAGKYVIYITGRNKWSSDGSSDFWYGRQDFIVTPPPPTNLSYVCSDDATHATFNWSLPTGFTDSYFRAYDQTNGDTFQRTGVNTYTGTFGYTNSNGEATAQGSIGNSYTISNLIPSHIYTWWVFTKAAYGPPAVIPDWSDAVFGMPVTCVPTPPPTVNLSASPISVVSGGSSSLSWTSTNATSCSASASPASSDWNGSKAVNPSPGPYASQTINPTTSTTYTLTCTGTGGTASHDAVVSVTAPVAINGSCSSPAAHNNCAAGTLDPSSVVENSSAYLWKCVGANGGSTVVCSETKAPPPVGTCYPTDSTGATITSANIGQQVIWTASDTSKSHTWTGENIPASASGVSYSIRYSTVGNKTARMDNTVDCKVGSSQTFLPIGNDLILRPI